MLERRQRNTQKERESERERKCIQETNKMKMAWQK